MLKRHNPVVHGHMSHHTMRDGPTQRGRACFTMVSRTIIAETLLLLAVWLVAAWLWPVYYNQHRLVGLSRLLLCTGIMQLRWALLVGLRVPSRSVKATDIEE